MGFLLSAITGSTLQAQTWGPFDDRWYGPVASPAVTGHRVTPELAMSVSTVFACVRVRSTVLAMLPLQMFRRLPNGPDGKPRGKERAHDHRISYLLHYQPNQWQTSYQWRQMLHGHVILRGNGYSEIVPGPRGFVDQLVPLHPAFVAVKDQLRDGSLVYEYRPPDQPGVIRRIHSDQMFHVMGPSDDGITGLSVVTLMRNSVGLALALQEHGGQQFGGNAPHMKGLITQEVGRAMDEPAQQTLTRTFAQANAVAGGVAYLPPGLGWQSVGMSNDDAQFLETRSFQVEDILRFMSVPGNLVGHADKTATFASAEAFFKSFVTIHMDPDFVMWEQVISRDLLLESEQETAYAKFNRTSLLRADAQGRAEYYRAMVDLGIMTPNEARELEDMNWLEGLDDPRMPMNMQRVGEEPPAPGAPPAPVRRASVYPPHIKAIITDVSARLVRREVAELGKAAAKYAGSPDGWSKAVRRFYEKFPDDVARALALSPGEAAAYCVERRERLLAEGSPAGLLEAWEQESGAALAGQVIGGVAA